MPSAFKLSSPTRSRHELASLPDVEPDHGIHDDEGAPPPVYRDDEAASALSNESAELIATSEASAEEHYRPEQSHSLAKYLPPQLQRMWQSTVVWVKGPQPPRPWKIRPFFPHVQTAPLRLLNNYFPKRKHKIALLVFFYFCWILTFGLVLHRSAFAADIPGYGSPVRVRCTDRF